MRKLFSVLAAVGLAVAVAGPAHAAPAWDSTNSWSNAVGWLEGELVDGTLLGAPPFPGIPAGTDWGMTIDMLIVLRASKLEPALAQALAEKIAANVDSYATSADWGDPDEIIGGATAKVLFAAVASGSDPLDFGGHNMRQRTLDLIGTDGWIHGSNNGSLTDGGNMFDQSLAVYGLAGSGGAPDSVVAFLLKQQCDDGGFPVQLSADPGGECLRDATDGRTLPIPHIDGTAMAIQALYAIGKKEQADKAVAWLASMQQPNGGFYDTWATPTPNTNSAGLAAQALYAAGKEQEAEKAAKFVRSLQLTTANAVTAIAMVGALALLAGAVLLVMARRRRSAVQ